MISTVSLFSTRGVVPTHPTPYRKPLFAAASAALATPASPLGWGLAMARFAGEQKLAPTAAAEDSYVRYTPYNTPCPPSTWHTLVKSEALAYHRRNAEVLEKYIQGTGEYYQDIPWIKHTRRVGEEPYTIFDTETTGTEKDDRIIQIAISQAEKNHEIRHLTDKNLYVNPGVGPDGSIFPINPGAEAAHGITHDMVRNQPLIESFLHTLRTEWIKENGLAVAYNARFDIEKLNYVIDRWNKSPNRKQQGYLRPMETALVLDPFVIIQRLHPFVSMRKRLGDQYSVIMGRDLENKHDAQADVDGTVDVLKYTFKYLQKHSIPLAWAQWVEAGLPDKTLAPEVKASVIARFVRENRSLLTQMLPPEPEALRITDILKFQHGAPLSHEGEPGLPKLDIALNFSGWDGGKEWVRLDDYYDAEVVQEVRQERDTDNRNYIQAMFSNEFHSQPLEEVVHTLHELLTTGKKESTASLSQVRHYKKELLQDLVRTLFMERVLAKTLPPAVAEGEKWQDNPAWQAVRGEVAQALNTAVETKLQGKKDLPAQTRQKLEDRLEPLANDIVAHMILKQAELGHRYFYTMVPVEPAQLIHPAMLSQKAALWNTRRAATPAAALPEEKAQPDAPMGPPDAVISPEADSKTSPVERQAPPDAPVPPVKRPRHKKDAPGDQGFKKPN